MMRTRRNRRTAWPFAMAWAFAGALALSFVQPSEAVAQSQCAEYISGGRSNPASGTLVGSRQVSVTGGFSSGVTATITSTFYVGAYRMHHGGIKDFRCDTYEPWGLF